ncbi:DUF6114 domain-containing protein [Streptomonospora litoralis]|uniref:Uncharacterized protein n=1 Tax=Streptomonospora litoralis TaxID=2498135 RepID=A0A4V0ZK46_9ACTN|nr:DUF6114 domain-containing protein [Streptomonospora litoralis]QBI55712.1 hypothetical protein EKD16_19745 [Streptomonospora litoralis]
MSRNGVSRAWQTARPAFRMWRRNRPFWGGLLIILAGIVIVAAPALNPLQLIVQQGIAGISGYFAGLLLIAVGVLVWLQPPQRFFYGIAAILIALVSFVTSNFGGFVFGMLFGLIGGALTIAWVPDRGRKDAGRRRGHRTAEEVGDDTAAEAAAGTAAADGAAQQDSTGPDHAHTGSEPAREIADSARDSGPGTAPQGGEDEADGKAESAAEAVGAAGDAAPTTPARPPGGGSGAPSEPGRPAKGGGASWRVDEPWSDRGPAPGRDGTAGTGTPGTGNGTDPPRGGDRLHSLAAVATALLLAVPAPASITWPWDDWFGGGGGGGEEQTPSPTPTPTPTPTLAPSPTPSDGPGGGAGDAEGDAGEDGGQGAEDGGDGEKEAPTAEECTVRDGEGPASMGEDEFRALLEACREAKEQGEIPEFDVREGDGRWLAHTEPSGLTADRLSMQGAAFEGVVEYPVQGGTVRYLKLSMDTAEFTGARQWSEHGGTTTSLEIPQMTMSGDVVMHVTRMKVRILGIPLEFTPSFPPPLLLPSMTVTDLEADQPLAQAQTVEITGLDERVETP